MSGWIKLHRSLLEWEWYDDVNTRVLFIHCLLKANHKDGKYRGKVVPRGSFLTGRTLLAEQTGLSVRSIRTSISKLESTNDLTIKATSKGTSVTVVNYSLYQGVDQPTTSETASATTNQRPATDQRPTTNKNDKKERIEEPIKSKPVKRFSKPTIEDILEYGKTLNPQFVRAESWLNYYESNGWKVGRASMKDWKAAVRTWQGKQKEERSNSHKSILDS